MVIPLYNTIINRFCNLHAFKYIESFKKRYYIHNQTPCTYTWLLHPFGTPFKRISFNSVSPMFSLAVAPRKSDKYSLSFLIQVAKRLALNLLGFLIMWHIVSFWFDSALLVKSTHLNPKQCGLNVLRSFFQRQHTTFQVNITLHHIIAYEDTVSLHWQRALLKPQASFGSSVQTARTPLALRFKTKPFWTHMDLIFLT